MIVIFLGIVTWIVPHTDEGAEVH